MEEKHLIYMDHAATTYTKKEVVDEMIPNFTEYFGNPSSIYTIVHESCASPDLIRLFR